MNIPLSVTCSKTNADYHGEETLLEAGENDVLFGRGGKTFKNPANRLFRRLIFHHKDLYETMKRPQHRQFLALSIVEAMHRNGSKFLRKERSLTAPSGEVWKIVSSKEACIKTSQALRDANVRTKKRAKGPKHDESSTKSSLDSFESRNNQRNRHVVSPCNSTPTRIQTETALPQIPSLETNVSARPLLSSNEENLQDIDHIDLETIHALVSSLGGNRPQQEPEESSYFPSSAASPSKRRTLSRWSLTRQPLNSSNRQSFTVLDWLSTEATPHNKLPPSALKPSMRQDYKASSTRCSISSLSMLEAGLFSADFEIDDFDIEPDSFAV